MDKTLDLSAQKMDNTPDLSALSASSSVMSTSTEVVYMCSSLLQLAPESCDLSQAEKRITVVILSENRCHFVNLFSFT